ncbi:MAG: hypothetical protein EZS28_053141 [Streblomastix strix]|uniref:Uncharacterized protein n=1 Tax=Streblomastix strix TaxID=222440 RepID=A0A5J4RJF3_9EUKA|nr:MAG: hypothetical protein EZS28_053141 [Streblomastix strix]
MKDPEGQILEIVMEQDDVQKEKEDWMNYEVIYLNDYCDVCMMSAFEVNDGYAMVDMDWTDFSGACDVMDEKQVNGQYEQASYHFCFQFEINFDVSYYLKSAPFLLLLL